MMDDTSDVIDNEFGKFPRYMSLTPDVFSFSYDDALKVVERFKNNADLSQALQTLMQFVGDSDLPEEQRNELIQLISEEIEVISYAVISRSAVVPV